MHHEGEKEGAGGERSVSQAGIQPVGVIGSASGTASLCVSPENRLSLITCAAPSSTCYEHARLHTFLSTGSECGRACVLLRVRVHACLCAGVSVHVCVRASECPRKTHAHASTNIAPHVRAHHTARWARGSHAGDRHVSAPQAPAQADTLAVVGWPCPQSHLWWRWSEWVRAPSIPTQ